MHGGSNKRGVHKEKGESNKPKLWCSVSILTSYYKTLALVVMIKPYF